MKKEFEPLYSEMNEEIDSCSRACPDEKERAETCFWLADVYWRKLKEIMKIRGFESDTDQIEFFKDVKPKFTCQMEYFIMLSGALTFVPDKREAAIDYWREEEKRFDRFRARNGNFVCYYELGSKEMDVIYFKQASDELKTLMKPVSYDNDPEFCSSHDFLVRMLLAHAMYHEYVMRTLDALEL